MTTDPRFKWRLRSCVFVVAVGMTGLGVRLAYLHLWPHDQEKLWETIDKPRLWKTKIDAERGSIYDRKGRENPLALDVPLKDVCADPMAIIKNNCVRETAEALSAVLDMPVDELAVKINKPGRAYALIKRTVLPDLAEPIAILDLKGIYLRDRMDRYYPHKNFLCHVLGFVNHKGDGCYGVEQCKDKHLRGIPGYLQSKKDALQRELYWEREQVVPPLAGADVYLTIDQYIQYIAEEAVQQAMLEHRAKAAWAIVQRVSTGEILALVNRPAFDLNEFRTADGDSKLNRAVGAVYEPGSTLKAITFASVLNEGLVTPQTRLDCENGAWLYGKRLLRDYHPYGILTVADGIKKSSNILTAKLALRLGDDDLYAYIRGFGFGNQLGVDLPGEEAGILHAPDRWSKISATRIAIGQGIAVTALQMLAAYNAIANDGILMRPYIISHVQRENGPVFDSRRPEILGRPISRETAATMRHLLSRVTEEGGTGKRAAVEGFRVAGKTGTAQKPVPGGYSLTDYVASFVGFLPAESPEIGIIVVVDAPQPVHTGGRVAAPVFKKIASQTVRYLGIPRSMDRAFASR